MFSLSGPWGTTRPYGSWPAPPGPPFTPGAQDSISAQPGAISPLPQTHLAMEDGSAPRLPCYLAGTGWGARPGLLHPAWGDPHLVLLTPWHAGAWSPPCLYKLSKLVAVTGDAYQTKSLSYICLKKLNKF